MWVWSVGIRTGVWPHPATALLNLQSVIRASPCHHTPTPTHPPTSEEVSQDDAFLLQPPRQLSCRHVGHHLQVHRKQRSSMQAAE